MPRLADFFAKMVGWAAPPPPAQVASALAAGLGAAIAIAVMAGLSLKTEAPWLMAPFGASCFLAFAVPDSPLAQPRNILFGHLISTAVGLMASSVLGATWWSMGLAVGLAVLLMLLTRTGHPPAGADPLLVMAIEPSYSFLLFPTLAGSSAIVLIALVFNNLRTNHRYPKFW